MSERAAGSVSIAECGAVGSAPVWGTGGRRFESCHSDVDRRRRPAPELRRAWICCAVSWLATCVGLVIAIVREDWLVGVYAGIAAVSGAGWLLAVRQWMLWRDLAEQTLAAASWLMRGDDES